MGTGPAGSQGASDTEMTGKGEEKARHHMGISDGRGSENDRNRKRNLGTSQLYFLGAPPHSPLEKTILGGRGAGNVPWHLSRWFGVGKKLFHRLVPRLAVVRDVPRVESGLFVFRRGMKLPSNLMQILKKEDISNCHSLCGVHEGGNRGGKAGGKHRLLRCHLSSV